MSGGRDARHAELSTGGMARAWRRAAFGAVVVGIGLVFAFPVLWLLLTSLRPQSGVFYVHRGLEFTVHNFALVLKEPTVRRAFLNSALIATLATVLSLGVTVTSGYMLSRFKGPLAGAWFGTIYLFRTIPYISWVLPLFLVTQAIGLFDTYLGLLLPHVAVHVCFFSWLMKGFFDGIEPEMEYAALIDGCSRWGAFLRIALPHAIPGIASLAILTWLFTWNEFLFALILTAQNTPILTVVMAQFVHELGMEWHLMSATAIMALVPALFATIFGQKYVVKGLRI
jgi:multiple sugar transport system permease protein